MLVIQELLLLLLPQAKQELIDKKGIQGKVKQDVNSMWRSDLIIRDGCRKSWPKSVSQVLGRKAGSQVAVTVN